MDSQSPLSAVRQLQGCGDQQMCHVPSAAWCPTAGGVLLTSVSLRTSSLTRSKSCQLADWPLHKRLCGRPVTIAAVADRGRGLVAVRDVAAGELILRDRAVVTLARGVKVEEAGYDITLLQRQVMLS